MLALLLAVLSSTIFLLVVMSFGGLRFMRDELPGSGRRAVGMIALAAVLAVCVFYPGLSGNTLAAFSAEAVWFPGLFFGHALLAVFLLVWWRLRRPHGVCQFLHLHGSALGDLWTGMRVGLLGWLITVGVMIAAGLGALSVGMEDSAERLPALLLWLADLPLGHKLLIIGTAMTVEEAFFRAFLQPRFGWVPSSLLFALAHAGYGLPIMLVGVLVISLIIGRLFARTRRLLPCIIAHGVFDAVQLLIIIPLAAGLTGSRA